MANTKEKKYVSDNAQLMAEWDWEKNNTLGFDPNTISIGSIKKVWWLCSECGHSWEATVNNRSNGKGCPKCAKTKRVTSFNQGKIFRNGSLATENPDLARQWHPTKNGELSPCDVTSNSGKMVWWLCEQGHEWRASIGNRNKGNGCPYCSNSSVLKGFNDLETVNPDLAAEWNHKMNGNLKPEHFTANSGKKVWWKCPKGHEWQAAIYSRNQGCGCPYCSGKKVLKGYNDLETINPTIAAEWNYEMNGSLKPEHFTANSGKKVWWKCSNGHEWQAQISGRSDGNGCPYCSRLYVIKGENDLQTINPTLAQEWNYEKNNGLTPRDVLPSSGKIVWWKCPKGHEWQAQIANRNNGNGCPICNSERQTSFPEYAIVFYLKKYGLDVIHSYKENGYELDIYIPSLKIAIEYDGYYWHNGKIKEDLEKNQKCKKDGIKLYRIREGLAPLNSSSIDFVVQRHPKDLSKNIKEIINVIIGISIDIDLTRDAIAIENLREFTEKERSILFFNPEIANEWNYEKNGNLRPEYFMANSHKKVWWKCSKGHEWQASIANRNTGHRCPYCSSKKVLKGYNDLSTVNPSLAIEWNYEKNGNLKPENFMVNSGRKVWLKCSKGHELKASIINRNKGTGCPYCVSQKVLKGYNDLESLNPILAKEWNYEKNNSLTPTDVTPNSHKKVWWKCSKGHEWQATIYNRSKGSGCPICRKCKGKSK